MSNVRRRGFLGMAAMAPLLGMRPAAAESAWPRERLIRFVVGYPPGQSVDVIARSYAAVMGKDLGQTIIVDNRAGANGIVGAQDVKQSKPDGYSLLFGTSGQMTINPALYRKLPYDPATDFVPVGRFITGSLFLVAHPTFPANNLQELINYARPRPGEIDFGSGGNGITAHLGMELLQAKAGIKLHHIPYKGTPAAITDLIGGQIALLMDSGPSILPHVKSGKLKVIACTGATRAAAFPSGATLAEQGMKDLEVTAWTGMWVPAGTPAAIVERLNASIRKASADPQLVDAMHGLGIEIANDSSTEFSQFIQAETRKWSAAVAMAGVKLD